MKTGEILLYDVIGDDWYGGMSAKTFAQRLKEFEDVDELNIRINSPGGSVFDGVSIYNQLRAYKKPVNVYVDALAASIASVIMLAGDKRHIAANATVMIHDPWSFVVGTATDMRKEADVLDKLRDTLVTTYNARTKLDADQARAFMAEETWFNADEALAHGFATEIVPDEEPKEQARFDLSRFKFQRLPPTVARRFESEEARAARQRVALRSMKLRRAQLMPKV